MKLLVVGGLGQGKLAYVQDRHEPKTVVDGGSCALEDAFSGDVLNRLHLLVRRLLAAGVPPQPFVLEALAGRERWIILCDEIGGGVVPLEAGEREYREQVGRLCCQLARLAQTVERLCCGLPQRLKG